MWLTCIHQLHTAHIPILLTKGIVQPHLLLFRVVGEVRGRSAVDVNMDPTTVAREEVKHVRWRTAIMIVVTTLVVNRDVVDCSKVIPDATQ